MKRDSKRLKRAALAFALALAVVQGGLGVVAADLKGDAQDGDDVPVSMWKLRAREDLSDVWCGATVGFDFKVRDDAVYAFYYKADRFATVAKQKRGNGEKDGWEFKALPTQVGWDSHNYLTSAFDADGFLHVSGNMHCVPLIYFRAAKPNDISTLEKIGAMTGKREKRCTYPRFMSTKEGRLVFSYRDGSSGNGDDIWNFYDEATKTWIAASDEPLFNGEKTRNAYPIGPVLGPDGLYSVFWCWRETPDCATNHDLSFARSKDLIAWEKADGTPIERPISLATGDVVDPIPVDGGLLNSLIRMGFDAEKRPIVSYSKRDDAGRLQIWVARPEADGWNRVAATDWDFRWDFRGGGCIANDLNFSAVRVEGPGLLSLSWSRESDGQNGRIYLDSATLKPTVAPEKEGNAVDSAPQIPEFTPEERRELERVESDDPRLLPRRAELRVGEERWIFRWEAPKPNRDQPQKDGAPKPTTLRVFKFERAK